MKTLTFAITLSLATFFLNWIFLQVPIDAGFDLTSLAKLGSIPMLLGVSYFLFFRYEKAINKIIEFLQKQNEDLRAENAKLHSENAELKIKINYGQNKN